MQEKHWLYKKNYVRSCFLSTYVVKHSATHEWLVENVKYRHSIILCELYNRDGTAESLLCYYELITHYFMGKQAFILLYDLVSKTRVYQMLTKLQLF